jgi:hypothetical protein
MLDIISERQQFQRPNGRGAPVRLIYIDEAGTSEPEPFTIVIGIIVDPLTQHKPAEEELAALVYDYIPHDRRTGFICHATDIWNSKIIRKGWESEERLALMLGLMSLPIRLKIPIAIGVQRRSRAAPVIIPQNISVTQYDHMIAFRNCIISADQLIKESAHIHERAKIVAEDCPDMRKFLRFSAKILNDKSLLHGIFPMEKRVLGTFIMSNDERPSRIDDDIRFSPKDGDPLLQISDACAFGFRRFLAGLDYGEEFFNAIFGQPRSVLNWDGTTISKAIQW